MKKLLAVLFLLGALSVKVQAQSTVVILDSVQWGWFWGDWE